MPLPRAWLVLAVAFVSPFSPAARVAGQPTALDANPGAVTATAVAATTADATAGRALVTGTLPNGLAYAVLPHASPKGDIGLRLVVRSGSLDERDDERGFAHFVEHMAFNGTRHHPPGSIRRFFQNLGLTFGPDLNATTSYTHTNYILDLPDGRADQLDRGLEVLRDYADGLLFPADQVMRESGVVVSELKARDSAGRRTGLQMVQLLFAGTSVPNREVSGVAVQLERATPAQLRAFYERTYLPSRMTVVLAGPLDAAAAIEKIKVAFGSMVSPAPGEGAAPAPVPDPGRGKGVKPGIVTVPGNKGANVQFIALTERPADNAEGRRRELLQRTGTAALSNRLRARRERGDVTQFGPTRVVREPTPLGPWVQHRMEIPAVMDAWTSAVQLMETELRRARTTGFSQAEVDEAAGGQLAYARNRVSDLSGRPASQLVAEVARQIEAGRAWQSPAAELAEATSVLGNLKAAEVTAEVEAIFPDGDLHLILITAPDAGIKPERLLAAYTKSTGRSTGNKPATETALAFRYGDFGPPGAVAKQERINDLDLTLVSFANEVKLNLRPNKLEPERFRLRAVFAVNLSSVPENRGGISELAGHLLTNSNLRLHPHSEIGRLLKLHGVDMQFGVNLGTPALVITGPAKELAFGLQMLTALLSDLSLDDDHYRVALSAYNSQHRAMMNTPGTLAMRAALHTYTGQDSRMILNHPQNFGNEASNSETSAWLREKICNGPLEIGLVGDFDPGETLKSAASSVATLKRRRVSKPGAPIASPQKNIRQEGSAELPASTSMSCVLWPVTSPDQPLENAALALATDILRDRQMLVLREMLGATYSPDARIQRDAIQRDFAFVAMINTFDPVKAQELTVLSLAVAAQLAAKGASAEEFTRLREPARTRRSQDLRNNGWWLNVVSVAQGRPQIIEEMRRHDKVVDELTIEDVNLAAQVFKPVRFTSVVFHPASANIPKVTNAKKKPSAAK